jgi:TolA-binding protein
MVFRFFRPEEKILSETLEGIKVPVRRVGSSAREDLAPGASGAGEISEVLPEAVKKAEPKTKEPEPEIEKVEPEAAPAEVKKMAPEIKKAVPESEEDEPKAAAPAKVSDMDEEIRKMEEDILGAPRQMTPAEKAEAGAHFNKATEFFKQGRYEDAISEWQKVLIINPGHELSKQKIQKAEEERKRGRP